MTPSSHPSIDELAAGEIDDIDIANLQRMQQMYERLDPAPSGLVDRISFGITLEALHAEIAEIQRVDSLAGVRSEGVSEAQTITFTSSTLTTMVTISPSGPDNVRIDGWIAPGGGSRSSCGTRNRLGALSPTLTDGSSSTTSRTASSGSCCASPAANRARSSLRRSSSDRRTMPRQSGPALSTVTDLFQAGLDAHQRGHPRQALRTLHRAAALGQRLPESSEQRRTLAAISISIAATVAETRGVQPGEAALREARALAEQVDDPALMVKVHCQAAFIAARIGMFVDAATRAGRRRVAARARRAPRTVRDPDQRRQPAHAARRAGCGPAPVRPGDRVRPRGRRTDRGVHRVAQPRLRGVPRRPTARRDPGHGRGGRAHRRDLARRVAARPRPRARRGRARPGGRRLAGRGRGDLQPGPARPGSRRDRTRAGPLRADRRAGAVVTPLRDACPRPVPAPRQRPLAP